MTRKTRKVLVVDDEPWICDIIREAAEATGCEVTEAFSGNQAIELIQNANEFDVVITDTRMRDGDGIDLLKFLYRTYGAGSRPVTYIHSSTDGYEVDERQVELPEYIKEHFPGTRFGIKDLDEDDDVVQLLRSL